MPDVPALDACRACPRLAAHLDDVHEQRPDYHCAPVACWGPRRHRLLLVGLAPGLHGANRTGRGFVGDASGRFLFEALAAVGLADAADPQRARLADTSITNVVKCLPPQNKVLAAELANCRAHLAADVNALWRPGVRRPRVLVSLGGVAHRALVALLQAEQVDWPWDEWDLGFHHGGEWVLRPNLTLLSSYHPSRQNVNTRRLDQPMLQSVLRRARRIIMEQ